MLLDPPDHTTAWADQTPTGKMSDLVIYWHRHWRKSATVNAELAHKRVRAGKSAMWWMSTPSRMRRNSREPRTAAGSIALYRLTFSSREYDIRLWYSNNGEEYRHVM
jgi:hypothetical protein